MAITSHTSTGNGSNKLFSFTFPYLETSDIDVYLNGALQTITTQYFFANATTVEFVTAPGNGVTVLIKRSTDEATISNSFFPGSSIKAADLNDNFNQVLFLAQETNNNVANAVAGQIPDGTITSAKIADGAIVDVDVSATAGIVATKLAFTQSGTGAAVRTVDSRLKDVVSVKDFGAVCDGTTNDAAAVSAANTAAAGRPLLFPGVTHIGSSVTITCPIVDTMQQIFSITSQVTINNKMPVRPDWWGDVENTLNYATNALPAGGGTVKLANRTYKSNNHAYTFGTANTVNCFSKNNVLYDGEKMPRLADDCRSLVGGTIIQDLVLGYANNIEFRNLGVDAGKTYCDIRYGGPPSIGYGEGLLLTYPDQIKKDAADLRRNARLHNIVGLSYSPSSATHSLIVGEGYQNVTCTGEIVGCYGIHGIVIKCGNVKAEQFTSYCNNGEGVIIKSDAQATAISYNIQIGKIFVDATGPDGWSPYATASTGNGLYLHCAANNIDGIQIGDLISTGYPLGITTAISAGRVLANVQIDSATIDCSAIAGSVGVNLQAPNTSFIRYFQCGNLHVRNCEIGVVAQYYGPGDVSSFANVQAVNVTDVVLQIGNTAYVNMSCVYASAVTNAIARITATPKLLFGQVFRDQAGCPMFHSGSGGLVPTLTNGWTQVASSDTFRVELEGGRIHMRGLIKPGSNNNPTQLPQWAWPSENKRFVALGNTTGTITAVPVAIDVNGYVYVNEIATGTANCTTWLSLAGCSWTAQA